MQFQFHRLGKMNTAPFSVQNEIEIIYLSNKFKINPHLEQSAIEFN